MKKLILFVVVFLSASIIAIQAHARVCPPNDRLQIRQHGQDPLTFSDAANYKITLGYGNYRGRRLVGIVERNGKCLGLHALWDKAKAFYPERLNRDMNLCFGSASINLNVLSARASRVSCGNSYYSNIDAFVSMGRWLNVYSGNRHDYFTMGNPLSWVYGERGNDVILTNGYNRLNAFYGENGNDQIYGAHIMDGGNGDDFLADLSLDNGTLIGGPGNDTIYSCRHSQVLCDGGYDTVYGPVRPSRRQHNCENYVKTTFLCN